jgi:hypothetical protein
MILHTYSPFFLKSRIQTTAIVPNENSNIARQSQLTHACIANFRHYPPPPQLLPRLAQLPLIVFAYFATKC